MGKFFREFLAGFLITVVFGGALVVLLWRMDGPRAPVSAEEEVEIDSGDGRLPE
jgi:hypothetical protein